MNKKAQTGFLSIMLAIVFFVIGLGLAHPLNSVVQGDSVRGVNGYDCSNVSISDQYKAYCTETDIIPPVFIGLIFGFAAFLLGGRVL